MANPRQRIVPRWCSLPGHAPPSVFVIKKAREKIQNLKHMKMERRIGQSLLLAALVAAPAAEAGTNGFIVPFFRGSANSEAGYWESFSTPVGAPGNLPNVPGATTGATLTQSDPNAFLTGSGNLYNLSGLSSFALTDTTPFPLGTVVLQTRTLGSELDYSSINFSYTDGFGTHSVAPLFRYEVDRGTVLGASVSSLWQWDLTGLGITSYSISFNAAGASLSFDSMTLDTWSQFAPVPEPSSMALAGMASLLLLTRAQTSRRPIG